MNEEGIKFLEILQRLNLCKINRFEIRSVSISYQEITHPSKNNAGYDFLRDGTMEISIRDTSLEKGLKFALAKFVWEYKSQHIYAPHRRSTVPALLPLITVVIPLALFLEIANGNLSLLLLVGPGLYSVLTFPFLLFLTKKKQEDHCNARGDYRNYLKMSEFYSETEIEEFVSRFTRKLALYHIVEYILFIPLLTIVVWLAFYLH